MNYTPEERENGRQFYEKLRRNAGFTGIFTGYEVQYPLRWHELDEEDRARYIEKAKKSSPPA